MARIIGPLGQRSLRGKGWRLAAGGWRLFLSSSSPLGWRLAAGGWRRKRKKAGGWRRKRKKAGGWRTAETPVAGRTLLG
jgi:hypothetical protein